MNIISSVAHRRLFTPARKRMRKTRLQAATAALVAILASTGLTFAATVPAQATPKQPVARSVSLVSADLAVATVPTPAAPRGPAVQAALRSGSSVGIENVVITDHSTNSCLDGREGTGGVTMQSCGSDGTHQIWARISYPGYDIYENQFNVECLDGRLGTGAVTVQQCGTDGAHQNWLRILYSGGNMIFIYRIENLFNFECLDNRPHVSLQTCGSDGAYELWLYFKQ